MSERYTPLSELELMSMETLRLLYAQVPTQRQKQYQTIYERQRQQAGATTDQAEFELLDYLLKAYQEQQLVPVGERWFRVPSRIREKVIADEPVANAEEALLATSPPTPLRTWMLMLLAGLVLLGMVGFIFIGGGDEPEPDPIRLVEGATITPTPRRTWTPTPIALEAQDTIIRDGDRQREETYPVGLQIHPAEAQQPRVFVVQGRVIEMAEWRYDPNPDVANFLNGLSVQPVIGIPWSRENQQLFDNIGTDTRFQLRLNTGAVREYRFQQKMEVQRSDTSAFRQVSPGLVLVLIGQQDRTGRPTLTRTLITARYLPEQELTRTGDLVAGLLPPIATPWLPPTATPIPARDLLHVDLIAVTRQSQRLTTHLRLYNGQAEPVTVTTADFQLALGYQPQPPGPWLTATTLPDQVILPGQALDITLHWYWQGEPYAVFRCGGYRFAIQII